MATAEVISDAASSTAQRLRNEQSLDLVFPPTLENAARRSIILCCVVDIWLWEARGPRISWRDRGIGARTIAVSTRCSSYLAIASKLAEQELEPPRERSNVDRDPNIGRIFRHCEQVPHGQVGYKQHMVCLQGQALVLLLSHAYWDIVRLARRTLMTMMLAS